MILVYHLGHCVDRLVLLFSLSVWNVNCSQREISRLPDLDLYFLLFSFFFLYPSASGMLSLGAAYCMLICSLTGATYEFECMPEKPRTDKFYAIVCF